MDFEMSHASHRTVALAVTVALLGTALAGCLDGTPEADQQPAATTHVSRQYTVTLTPEVAKAMESSTDPESTLKNLIKSSLVVRVLAPGDYTLEYTDKNGAAQTKTLPGLEPGKPHEVADVDPFTAVTLKLLGQTVYERAPKTFDGYKFGVVPLGFKVDAGSEAAYKFNYNVVEEFGVKDLKVPSEMGEVNLDSLLFRLAIPLTGTMGWKAGTASADGIPVALTATASVPADARDLLLVDAKGTMDGKTNSGGFSLQRLEAESTGTGTLWFKENEPAAAQWNGGRMSAHPHVTGWATGPLAESAEFSCAGKARADNCRLEEVYKESGLTFPVSENVAASSKEFVPASARPQIENPEQQKIVDFLTRLFAQDLELNDVFTVMGAVDSYSLGIPNSDGSFTTSMVYKMTVAEKGPVVVSAGAFQGLKLVTTLTTKADVKRLSQGGKTVVNGFDFDEEVSRSTLWLEQGTYVPLKLEATTPLKVDALVDEILGSIDQGIWRDAKMTPLTGDKLNVKVEANYGYEATRVAAGAKFSPIMGIAMSGVLSSAPTMMPAAMVGMRAAEAIGDAFGGT
ncbi:MAG TPA: hypothetical protein VNZ52_13060, partial [Candidatus Thermoplasmatota archaeon]|nr:hypothetical protein [Candidatus Thermoplasmatota archaeon]